MSLSKSQSATAEKQRNLVNALAEVQGGVSIRQAAKKYGIPQSTLGDKVRGKYKTDKRGYYSSYDAKKI